MKIRIKGKYTNGNEYDKLIPKDSLSLDEAQALLISLDLSDNQSTDNGYALDFNTLTAELYDDVIIEPVEISRLKCELLDRGMLNEIESYMKNKNGKVRIYWENVKMVDYYHEYVQNAITDLNLPKETAMDIFIKAINQ